MLSVLIKHKQLSGVPCVPCVYGVDVVLEAGHSVGAQVGPCGLFLSVASVASESVWMCVVLRAHV